MGFFKTNQDSITTSTSLINDFMFKCRNRTQAKYFCREGKIGFKNMILFMLNMLNQSLQVELNRFFENILKKDFSISKQAFSEARQKITPKAFTELNDAIMDVIYVKNSEYELWNGFRVLAVDGSVLEIPDTKLLREIYGCANSRTGSVARATSSSVFDVINKIVIKSKIDRYKTCEREMAKSMISAIPKSEFFNDLILFDRGYPSTELMSFLIDRGNYFVMRAKARYSNMVINAKKEDQITKFIHSKKEYTVRVVRFKLSSGEEEILITNLTESKYTLEVLKELYFKRWGIETKYYELKNRLEIENFSGQTKIAIEQDFYASIYLSNMVELARNQCDEVIKNKNTENKYVYKVNLNILIGKMKDKLILILLEPNNKKRTRMFKELIKTAERSAVPVRPDRHYPRKFSFSRSKYIRNKKRCL